MLKYIQKGCMFCTKDRNSFENCLRENNLIPTLGERQKIKRKELAKVKHRKLILKMDQPLVLGLFVDFYHCL